MNTKKSWCCYDALTAAYRGVISCVHTNVKRDNYQDEISTRCVLRSPRKASSTMTTTMRIDRTDVRAAAPEGTQTRLMLHRPPLVMSVLLLAAVAWLLAGCGESTNTGGATPTGGTTTTCATALPGSSPIDLGSHGFAYPFTAPASTVSSTISTTASGAGLFTVNQFTACSPNTSVGAVQSFYNSQLPALQHGWSASTTFPADGGLMSACSAPCFWNAKGGNYYSLVFDQFNDHGSGVVTYRGRWAAFDTSTLPDCGSNFGPGNTGAQRDVFFVGSDDTAFSVPPLSSIAADDASGGVQGYEVCSPGTAASVNAFLAKEAPADGWMKVTTSNPHCIVTSNCWTKNGQVWSWNSATDAKLWLISFRR